MTKETLNALVAAMEALQYEISREPGQINIVYLEGADREGRPAIDKIDGWNDRRLVFDFVDAAPRLLINHAATTEPGLAATWSRAAKLRGGVARIVFGQYRAWRIGYHKKKSTHPALVQVAPLSVTRDANRDGLRPGDKIDTGLFGINQHGTSPRYAGGYVGMWSEGCLVGKVWAEHLAFMRACASDPRYVADNKYVFFTTIMPAGAIEKK